MRFPKFFFGAAIFSTGLAAATHNSVAGQSLDGWNYVSSVPGLYLMLLEIEHSVQGEPARLAITVEISRTTKEVTNFYFAITEKVDKSRGLLIGFTNSQMGASSPDFEHINGQTWAVPFNGFDEGEDPGKGNLTITLPKGLIPTSPTTKNLNLLSQFLKFRTAVFAYWVNGKQVTVSTNLSDFQRKYPQVLKRLKCSAGGLTSRSTRTPPALPSALSQFLASSAPFSASAQAWPVSFIR